MSFPERGSISGLDVITYVDRLTDNLVSVAGGDRVRALVLAIALTADSRSCEAAAVEVVGGVAFLDAVLVLLRSRLADASCEFLADKPIPYALTAAAVAL